MKVELRDHHAQARHPITNERLYKEDGSPVPLFPFLRSFYLDDHLIGQTGDPPDYALCFSVPNLPEAVIEEVRRLVCEEFGLEKIDRVTSPVVPEVDDVEE